LWHLPLEHGREVLLDGASQSGRVNRDGLFIPGTDGRWVNVQLLQVLLLETHESTQSFTIIRTTQRKNKSHVLLFTNFNIIY
jgi:hypothetical protein